MGDDLNTVTSGTCWVVGGEANWWFLHVPGGWTPPLHLCPIGRSARRLVSLLPVPAEELRAGWVAACMTPLPSLQAVPATAGASWHHLAHFSTYIEASHPPTPPQQLQSHGRAWGTHFQFTTNSLRNHRPVPATACLSFPICELEVEAISPLCSSAQDGLSPAMSRTLPSVSGGSGLLGTSGGCRIIITMADGISSCNGHG